MGESPPPVDQIVDAVVSEVQGATSDLMALGDQPEAKTSRRNGPRAASMLPSKPGQPDHRLRSRAAAGR